MKRILYLAGPVFLIAAENSHAAGGDLLTVDKTIVVQGIIIIAAMYILNSLIFRPLLKLLKRRKDLTSGSLDEAKRLMERTEELIRKYNGQIEEARTAANEQRAEIRNQAQQAADEMIQEIRGKSQALVETYKEDLDFQVKKTKERIRPEIEGLAREVTSKILGKEV